MTTTEPDGADLSGRVAAVLQRTERLERAYRARTVGEIVTEKARAHGSKVALELFERDERMTYEELDIRSNQYAHALRNFGVNKGDRVAVLLPNRIEFPLVWFAIAKLGAVIVPLNVNYTSRELEYVLTDTSAQFAVIDDSFATTFWDMDPWPATLYDGRVLVVGDPSADRSGVALHALLGAAAETPVTADVTAADLLSIQYTSGTTGFPKGCMLPHEYWDVAARVFADADEEPFERTLSWSPFFYTYGQMEVLKSLEVGGTLYVAERLSSKRFLDWVRQFRIEWCTLPELVALQMQPGDEATKQLKQAAQNTGWTLASIRHFNDVCGVFAHNPYAMTETGWCTQMPQDLEEMTSAVSSLGIRAPFREMKLVGEDSEPVEDGEVGELLVKGRGLFRGYWGRPEANAQSFDDGWFKTGDLLRRDELGFYFFVGRTKDMIRRSGENISAVEVEAVIGEVAEVADVAAVPVQDVKRGEEVKVCIELVEGVSPSEALAERILLHAASRLAAFKVPRYVAFVPVLPRTVSSHKIMKHELTKHDGSAADIYDRERIGRV